MGTFDLGAVPGPCGVALFLEDCEAGVLGVLMGESDGTGPGGRTLYPPTGLFRLLLVDTVLEDEALLDGTSEGALEEAA